MNATEKSIADKLTAEIEAATGEVRSKLITDLWTVVCTAEKRVALEGESIFSELAAEAQAATAAVGREIKTVVGEVEARL